MYIAVGVRLPKENVFGQEREKECFCAYAVKLTEYDNVCAVLDRIGGLMHANVCTTKKRAAELVNAWNDAYRANGTYAFSGTF